MANKQRGEATIEGPEGKKFTICLTLGAVAEIEEQMGVESLSEISGVFEKAKMRDLITILVALLHGGGNKEITADDMMSWPMDMGKIMSGIRDAFSNAGFGEAEESEDTEAGDTSRGKD